MTQEEYLIVATEGCCGGKFKVKYQRNLRVHRDAKEAARQMNHPVFDDWLERHGYSRCELHIAIGKEVREHIRFMRSQGMLQ